LEKEKKNDPLNLDNVSPKKNFRSKFRKTLNVINATNRLQKSEEGVPRLSILGLSSSQDTKDKSPDTASSGKKWGLSDIVKLRKS
jgi:hypothetical protein